MKKLLSLTLLLILLTFMGACNKQTQLDSVKNISYNNYALTWDEVEDAQEYLLSINEQEFSVSANYYPIVHEGTYNIQIIARGEGFVDSKLTSYELVIDYNQNVDIVLIIINETVNWTEVEDATHYFLVINQDIIRVETNNFNIASYLNEDYQAYVYAVFPDGSKSLNSNILTK
jgi:hypothetical protein